MCCFGGAENMSRRTFRIFSNAPSNVTEHYDVRETLGSGHFAKVKRAVDKRTGEQVALKILPKKNLLRDPHQRESLISEIDILTTASHPNIICLKAVYETTDQLILVMELVTGGELFDRIVEKGQYTEEDACNLMKDLVGAIKYLHERNIAHRDLKPENILLDSQQDDACIKVSDFGLSKLVDSQQMMQTCCGTPGYVAPEVLTYAGYGPEVDMWSIGVVLYIILCGFPPFYDENDNDAALYAQIQAGRYEFISPYWDGISREAKDLISRLLVVSPTERLTAEQCLAHPWFTTAAKPSEPLSMAQANLKRQLARRRFKAAARAAIVAKRMERLSLSARGAAAESSTSK
eukprot:gnl/Trimastix_PCT/730.p1 GENE.gnl/Trimastix_PCT/730~~gnl/Trimastix_PCT/730.p1  ORF type:complete len:348 (+),score=75.38 gnl/Trimastix_PCT/730:7-1050(+)